MKYLYTLIFTIISFSLSSQQETIIGQWDFTSDTTMSTGTYSGSGTTDISQILDYSTLNTPTLGYVKLDVPNSPKYSANFCTGIGLNTGKINFSITLDGWKINTASGSFLQIRFRDPNNKMVATIKVEEVKSGSPQAYVEKTKIVGNLWDPASGPVDSGVPTGVNGTQKYAGHFGDNSLNITETHTIGLTIDYDNDTYSFWTETPNSPTYNNNTREFVYDNTNTISGNTPSDMTAGVLDRFHVSYKLATGEYFNLSQIKISTGDYANTASTKIDTKSNFHIYPNPAQSYFIVENAIIDDKLEIYNVGGKLIKTQTIHSVNEKINIEELKRGIYFVKIDDREAIRLIKK